MLKGGDFLNEGVSGKKEMKRGTGSRSGGIRKGTDHPTKTRDVIQFSVISREGFAQGPTASLLHFSQNSKWRINENSPILCEIKIQIEYQILF
jgi:hypothetical protein